MTKNIITLILILTSQITVFAQTQDSVSTGSSNINDVYYSFANGIVKTTPNNNWDLAFEITGFTASILVNHVKGIDLYQTPFAISQWSNFDTAGYKNFKKMYNSEYSWSMGAFNRHTDNNYDLGWGTYSPETHIVAGDSLFLVKFADGSFKKIQIINLFSGVYNFKYSSIDGSGEKIISIAKSNFKNKNFAYFAFANDTIIDREPLNTDWDIVFTKYSAFIPQRYSVAGVWTNKNTKCAEAKHVSKDIANFSSFNFSDTNSIIGYDWKKYNATLGQYTITDSLVYFIQNQKNNYWKIYFTGYKGGTSGTYFFTKQTITASVPKIANTNFRTYPNPANNIINIDTDSKYLKYEILNSNGLNILNGNGHTIDISSLASGFFYIKIYTETGFTVEKFLKN